MKRLTLILMLALFILPFSNAQLWKYNRYEVSGYIGTSQFFGDVGGYSLGENTIGFKDLTIKQTRFSIGGQFKYWVLEDVAVRGNLALIMLHGTDIRGSNIGRGFENTTTVVEPYVAGEYYFIRNKVRNSYLFIHGRKSFKSITSLIDLYAMAGLGGCIYHVNPNDALAAREKKSSGFCVVFPVGVGASIVLTPKMSVGAEITSHFTLTDYLDGYTSQYSARNDLFYTLDFKFDYKFSFRKQGGLPTNSRR